MAGIGGQQDKKAVALGLVYYFNEDTMMTGSLALDTTSSGSTPKIALGMGIIHKFGDSKEIEKLPEKFRTGQADAVLEIIKENEELKTELTDLKEKVEYLMKNK